MAAADDREDVALSSSELDDVLSSAGLAEDTPQMPADDLELYGVWVKVKPQPVATRPPATAELADLESAEPTESAELTDDEQDLLAELETGTPEPEPMMSTDLSVDSDLSLPEMPSLMQEDTLTITDEPEPGALDDLSLEEPGGPNLDSEVAALDAELGSLAEEPVQTASGLPSLEEEEIRLESTLTTEEQMPSLELEDELVLDEPAGLSLETDIDLEAETAGSAAVEDSLPALDEDIILEEPGMDDLTPEEAPKTLKKGGVAELEAADAFEPETPLGETDGDGEGIDLETEMVAEARPPSTARQAPARADAASLILEKIEQELHAIRHEISDLKSELTVLRKERDELTTAGKPEEEKAAAGFFGGEEDETIALTGDELDNILSTADVTEAPQVPTTEVDLGEADLGDAGILDTGLGDTGLADVELGDTGAADVGLDLTQDVIAEDILDRAENDLDLTAETPVGDGELSIPEEELVDSSSDDSIQDESSLLSTDPLGGVDLGGDMEEGIIVETDEPEDSVSADLAADLAAEAEAAVAEHRSETPVVSDEFLLETEDTGPTAAELDLSDEINADLGAELGSDLGGTGSPEMEIEMDLDGEASTMSPPVETDRDLVLDEEPAPEPAPQAARKPAAEPGEAAAQPVPEDLRDEIKSVLAYLDQLLEALPDEKIEEFAKSEYFGVYKKLFVELGLED